MRDFSVELIWAKIQAACAVIGGWLGFFLGGMDGMLIALIVFMALDYVTGIMCAILDKKLSSAVGFKGAMKKAFILILVGVANVVDVHVVGTGSALRGVVICFYLSNEGLSLLEKRCLHRPARARKTERHSGAAPSARGKRIRSKRCEMIKNTQGRLGNWPPVSYGGKHEIQ